jgi:environmental stress-induced protein Ves
MTRAFDLFRADDLIATPWKNGGGSTREIAAYPPGSTFDDFAWRVSIADVAADGPFSRFAGIDRTIVLLDGDGMKLILDGAGEHRLDTPFEPFEFAGEAQVAAVLLDGPTRDFNLMIRRGLASGGLSVLHGPSELVVERDIRTLFIARGRAVLIDGSERTELGTHDSAVLHGGPLSLSLPEGTVVFAMAMSSSKPRL